MGLPQVALIDWLVSQTILTTKLSGTDIQGKMLVPRCFVDTVLKDSRRHKVPRSETKDFCFP